MAMSFQIGWMSITDESDVKASKKIETLFV